MRQAGGRRSRTRKGILSFRFFKKFSAGYGRRLKNLALAFIVVLATIFSLFVFVLFQRFAKSTASASSTGSSVESIDSEGRFNILLGKVNDLHNPTSSLVDLMILTVEFSTRRAGLYRLPIDLEVSDLGGFGQNKLRSLFGLANLSSGKDLNFISRQVQEIFSIPIDGQILTDDAGVDAIAGQLGLDIGLERLREGDLLFFLRKSAALPTIFSNIRTNIRPLALFTLFNKIILSRFNVFKVENLNINLQETAPSDFYDSRVEEEGKTIIVLNGAGVPLLAARASRLIKGLGGRVLETSNAPGDPYLSSVIISRGEDSHTQDRLKRVLNIHHIRSSNSFEDDGVISPYLRADIIVILGADYPNQHNP